MNNVDRYRALHDKLMDKIMGECETLPIRDSERDKLVALINQYGTCCMKLVEAEHAECGS